MIASKEIESRLRKAFFQFDLFIAGQIGIPEVFFDSEGGANEDDVCFHEFASVESTDEEATDVTNRTIGEFVEIAETSSEIGWKAFDPLFPRQ